MTRAFGSRGVVKTLLKAWNIKTESHIMGLRSAETLYGMPTSYAIHFCDSSYL